MNDHSHGLTRQYAITNPDLIQVSVVAIGGHATAGFSAELRDLSRRRASLLVAGPIQARRHSQVLLASPLLSQTLRVSAEMEWVRPNAAGDWLLGCGFSPEIPETSFRELLDTGLLDRRASPRQRIRVTVQVNWKSGLPPGSGVVCDVSAGGICLSAPECPDDLRHFSISGRDGRGIIELKAQWWVAVPPNYFIGCEFLHPEDVAVLKQMQFADQADWQETVLSESPSYATNH